RTREHGLVGPATVVVDQYPVHAYRPRVDRALLDGLAQRRPDRRLVAVPRAARRTPRAAVTAPPAALLEQHHETGVSRPAAGPGGRGTPVLVVGGKQKPGRAVPAPVPMAAAAPGPAVPVAGRHRCRR